MVDEVTKFILKYGGYDHQELTHEAVEKYSEYGTYVLVRNTQGEVVAFVGFDISDTQAYIINCVIRPDFRFKKILKLLCFLSLEKFPFLKTFTFERDKNKRTYNFDIERFLGGTNGKESKSTHSTVY